MQPPIPNYGRRFKRLAIMYILHHGLLAHARRTNKPRLARTLHHIVKKRLTTETLGPAPSPAIIKKYKAASQRTTMWHGTGRLQYQNDTIVDVLQGILKTGELQPKRDVYALAVDGKEMHSLSGTKLRIIARSYADTHGHGVNEQERYGSSLWWVSYYYGLCYALLFATHGLVVVRNWSRFEKASRDANGERTWGKKVHRQAKHVWDVFGLGSDIPGNYPILFGLTIDLRRSKIPKVPRALESFEVRILEPVTVTEVSHIEVPRDKVTEVRTLLKQHGYTTPVFSIEIGEWLAAQQEIGELLYPKPLK